MNNLSAKRQEKIKRRKNLFPTLILIFLFWGILTTIIFFLNPQAFGAVPMFFLILFLAVFLSLSLVFGNSRRGLLYSIGFLIFSLLRYFGVGHLLNLLLILGIAVAFDFYLSKK